MIELGVPKPLDSLENLKPFNRCSNIAEMKFKIIKVFKNIGTKGAH